MTTCYHSESSPDLHKTCTKVNKLSLHSVPDCPSLLCEELEDLETKNDQGRMRRRREGEEEVYNQREDEEAGEEPERDEKVGEEEKDKKKSERELVAAEGEEEEETQTKAGRRLQEVEAHDVQMEDDGIENNKETISEKPPNKETKRLEEKEEQKKGRKRRGRKQSDRVRNRRGVKDVGERLEEKKKNHTRDVSAMSSEESSTLSETPFGLMNSSDLSDPIYLGCGGTGMYCPPVPIPILYSSQPPVPIQPAPPQPQGTKRPRSPLLTHGLPQQGPQPVEVRRE